MASRTRTSVMRRPTALHRLVVGIIEAGDQLAGSNGGRFRAIYFTETARSRSWRHFRTAIPCVSAVSLPSFILLIAACPL